jgi:hypothetical protein
MKNQIKKILRESLLNKNILETEYKKVKETEKAYLISFKVYKNSAGNEENMEIWVPKSIIDIPNKVDDFIQKAVFEKNKNLEIWMKSKGYGHLRGGAGYSLIKPKEKEKIKITSVDLTPESFPNDADDNIFYNYMVVRGDSIKVLNEDDKTIYQIKELYEYSLEHPNSYLLYIIEKRRGISFFISDKTYDELKKLTSDDTTFEPNQIIQLKDIKFKNRSHTIKR